MTTFSQAELDFLATAQLLGRLATVGADGMPHVTPVGWQVSRNAIEIRGRDFAATKKFRDVQRTGIAALLIDEVLPPWRPRGIEVRGHAEALNGPEPLIRIHPTRIISWGLQDS